MVDLAGDVAGGSVIGNTWSPLGISATCNRTLSDRLTGATLDPKWLAWAQGTPGQVVFTPSAIAAGLGVSVTGVVGANQYQGIYQELGGITEFSAYLRVRVRTAYVTGGNSAVVGIALGENFSGSASSDFRSSEIGVTTAAVAYARTWSAYNGSQTALTTLTTTVYTWIRVRASGVLVATDFSADGLNWGQAISLSLGFSPNEIAIVGNSSGAGVSLFYVDSFTVFSGAGTSGLDHIGIGGPIRILAAA